MIKALIVDNSEIYCGEEAFDNGEGGYVELFSNKLNRPYRVYSGEYDAFELTK
jgi:hypothetical protein